ncbi:pectinesterase family protein [Streptomyces sp. NPDC008150]|uniref:pectinesterase family protein n=1 Tax=Streptomyces sp. NPDC008150 TaxID=3364816 RepID=UPI0036EED070
MPSPALPRRALSRRGFLTGTAAAGAALALTATPARALPAAARRGPRARPFGRYGSPAARLTPATLYVDPHGRGDFTAVRPAVDAATATGQILVIAPGVYRETVTVTAAGTTWIGAGDDPRDVVIVYDNANGTPKPDGSGTYGTSGSATTLIRGDAFTAVGVTFANDWLRADHPEITGTQAVAIKVQGDRAAFHRCRFLGHQDTLYADSSALTVFARQYYADCYAEGDVDFVFGRATAVFERCHFHTLNRTDLASAPYGFVFAPSTAVANPYGYLVTHGRITGDAPDAFYKLARPWVPSSDTTARPMLTVRDTWLGPGIDAAAPYTNMSDAYPWQSMRFAEHRDTGPGARVTVPANRPQLTRAQAESATRAVYLGDWAPWTEARTAPWARGVGGR